MTLTRRTLVLAALALWLGGFTFYSAVVVPIGSEQLGFVTQGFITRNVTAVLNVIGTAALVPLAWDAWAGSPRVRWQRLLLWVALAATLAALWALHPHLADLMDPEKER